MKRINVKGDIDDKKARGQEGWPFKRDRRLEGWKDSLLTLISHTSIPPYLYTSKRHAAFTMAEILISLTIIGIIAAITLPSLIGNMNEKTFAAKRKALYSRMSQAIALMPSLNGYGVGADEEETINKATENFITEGLSKVLKIINICDSEHLKDCGLAEKINIYKDKINFPKNLLDLLPASNSRYIELPNTKVAGFQLISGESLAIQYNPNCRINDFDFNNPPSNVPDAGNTFQYLCANFIYDLNGKKGPNKYGKDIGSISAFYPIDSTIVAPDLGPISKEGLTYADGQIFCRNSGDNQRIPTMDEWMGIYVNYKLVKNTLETCSNGHRFFSSINYKHNPSLIWTMYSTWGIRAVFYKTSKFCNACVKR